MGYFLGVPQYLHANGLPRARMRFSGAGGSASLQVRRLARFKFIGNNRKNDKDKALTFAALRQLENSAHRFGSWILSSLSLPLSHQIIATSSVRNMTTSVSANANAGVDTNGHIVSGVDNLKAVSDSSLLLTDARARLMDEAKVDVRIGGNDTARKEIARSFVCEWVFPFFS